MNKYMGESDRANFIVDQFGEYMDQSQMVMDVGARTNNLNPLLESRVYTVDNNFDGKASGMDLMMDITDDTALRILEDNASGRSTSVVLSHVLEHLEKPAKTLRSMRGITTDYILVGLPNEMSWLRRYQWLLNDRDHNWTVRPEYPHHNHRWMFTVKTARDFCDHHLEGWQRVEEQAPSFDMSEAKVHTRWMKRIMEYAGESVRARDWWGLYCREL